MNELVSILIPCYNAERWIGGAIDSALSQDWEPKEVIVVDDGSTDGSLEAIQKFGSLIRWESGPNRGGNATRNRLLELSRGTWLQYLDADDYLLPSKISGQMKFLESSPETDVLYGPVTFEHVEAHGTRSEVLPIPEPHDPWILLARWYLPQTGGPLWKRKAMVEAGRWKEGQPCCQEHELYLRMLIAGKRFTYSPQGGAVYRQWSDQTVCKRDVPLVNRHRLAILLDEENFLRSQDWLTKERQLALHHARFEMARTIWQYDKHLASDLIHSIQETAPDYEPTGVAAPSHYRMAFRWFGFSKTERIADLVRKARNFVPHPRPSHI